MSVRPARIGVLSCASVTDYALIPPAKIDGAIEVVSIASRDAARAQAWAKKRGVAKSYGSYDALLAAGGADAIYIPLPNAMHHEWVIKSLRAGYPVLCEKPMANNARQAAEMAKVARETGLPLIEAFHWRHHPMAARAGEIVRSGQIGQLRKVDTSFRVAPRYVPRDNIRFDYNLGGGVTMDQGGYCISMARWITGENPIGVDHARADVTVAQIDDTMSAQLRFPNDVTAQINMTWATPEDGIFCQTRIEGDEGSIILDQPFLPHLGCRIAVQGRDGAYAEHPTTTMSYVYQARDLAALLRGETPEAILPPEDAVANMTAIDEVYRAAGLKPRP